ncbi:Non-specific lipid-transfer protein 3 [Hibiscus syriacus]|uniref:Non-specific lipid-transfer protein 3 n=1 Tax=Hibiscus syriacus TaxID=106335 RepID=A0A6A3BGL6_HIBSY|nr:Non-specific lipid-transfer protein 3 [Hibiscus syriacus]
MGYLQNGGALPGPCCDGVRALNGMARTTPNRQTACRCLQNAAKNIPNIKAITWPRLSRLMRRQHSLQYQHLQKLQQLITLPCREVLVVSWFSQAKGFDIESLTKFNLVSPYISFSVQLSKKLSLFNPFDETLYVEEINSWSWISDSLENSAYHTEDWLVTNSVMVPLEIDSGWKASYDDHASFLLVSLKAMISYDDSESISRAISLENSAPYVLSFVKIDEVADAKIFHIK